MMRRTVLVIRSDDKFSDLLRAAEFEEKALAAVDPAKARTRAITAVSAVSLKARTNAV